MNDRIAPPPPLAPFQLTAKRMNSTALLRPATLLVLMLAAAFHPMLQAEPAGAAEQPTDLSFGQRQVLHSKVLGRDQEIWIYTPPSYADSASNPRVPVLYFPDAGSSYLYLAGLVDFLASDGARVPPMVLVGIANGQDAAARIHDLSPAFSAAHNGGGGAEQLYRFIHDEVIPYTEARYRAAPFRILVGHSLGGLFAVYVLRAHPETFNAVIASSPSLSWDDRALLKNPAPWGRAGQLLFFTTESPDWTFPHQTAVGEFSKLLREHAAAGLKWEFKGYPSEWHGSVYLPGVYDGLEFIFPDWNFQLGADLSGEVTYTQLVEHSAKLSRRYGYDIPVSLATVRAVTTNLCAQKRFQDALALCVAHVERFPDSSGAHALLASVYLSSSDAAAARAQYEKALALDPKNTAAKRALDGLPSAR